MSEYISENPVIFIKNQIIEEAHQYVIDLYNDHKVNGLLFHNYSLVKQIDQNLVDIYTIQKDISFSNEIVRLAGIFYPTGYITNYKKPLIESIKHAADFLHEQKYPEQLIHRVKVLIQSIDTRTPNTLNEQLLIDGINQSIYTERFKDLMVLEKAEKEIIEEEPISNLEWTKYQLHQLLDTHFYLPHTKANFENIVGKNIVFIKNKLKKLTAEELAIANQNKSLEDGIPLRSVQTFFKTNFRTHINLSAIADNKASIMISVNAIALSVIVTILSYRNIPETNPGIMAPAILIMASSLVSLIFSVLSSRPRITRLNDGEINLSELKKNISFFGNFSVVNLERFEEIIDEVLRDSDLLYTNMVRDLYHLGCVLNQKYKYLTISYNIFMAGFVVGTILLIGVLMF